MKLDSTHFKSEENLFANAVSKDRIVISWLSRFSKTALRWHKVLVWLKKISRLISVFAFCRGQCTGVSCSKLMKLLANQTDKFLSRNMRNWPKSFALKMWIAFPLPKVLSMFVGTISVNFMLYLLKHLSHLSFNRLIKLIMLWTSGPKLSFT